MVQVYTFIIILNRYTLDYFKYIYITQVAQINLGQRGPKSNENKVTIPNPLEFNNCNTHILYSLVLYTETYFCGGRLPFCERSIRPIDRQWDKDFFYESNT